MRFWSAARERAACAEAREADLLGVPDSGVAARVARHLARCPACQAERARLEGLRADLRADPVPLDDLTRARILDRLIPALDDAATTGGQGRRATPATGGRTRFARGLALAGAAAAAAALALTWWTAERRPGSPAEPTPAPVASVGTDTPVRSGGAAASAAGRQAASAAIGPSAEPAGVNALALIRPIDVAAQAARRPAAGRMAAAPAGADGQQGVQRLVVPAGARQRALLGDRTRLLLVGPAELEVLASTGGLLEVRLGHGALVGHYRHGGPGRLRIRSPGTRTDVVGTTFYVEAQPDRSRVAVAEGRVLVRGPDDRSQLVSAGQLWSSGGGPDHARRARLRPLPRPIAGLFAEDADAPPPTWRTRAAATTRAKVAGTARAARSDAPGTARAARSDAPATARAARSDAPAVSTSPAARSDVPAASSTRANGARAAREALALLADDGGAPAGQVPAAVSDPVGTAAPAGPAAAAVSDPLGTSAPPASPSPAVSDPPGAATPTAPASASALYRRAEQAMSRGDQTQARHLLRELAGLPDAGALGSVARYELAQLALRAGDLPEARAQIDQLRPAAAPDVAEAAAFLACEIELRAGHQTAARRCYTRFRERHPASVQDAEALSALLRLSPPADDCTTGRALIDQYLARHPAGPLAAEARRRREACHP